MPPTTTVRAQDSTDETRFTGLEARSPTLESLDQLRRDNVAMVGAAMILLVVMAAVLAPFVSPHDPETINASRVLAGPSTTYPFGNDELGRDLLSRTLWGSRVSLPISLLAMMLSLSGGMVIGLLSGFFGGRIDMLAMRVIDVLLAFPGLVLVLALVAVLGQDIRNLVFALAIGRLPDIARLTRGMAMTVGAELYVEAARSSGAGNARIIFRHVLPNSLAPIIVAATSALGGFILVEAALSFLGLGIQPPTPSWGAMLNTGKAYMQVSPWMVLWPGLAIFITVLGFNLLGDGIRDATDPRMRGR